VSNEGSGSAVSEASPNSLPAGTGKYHVLTELGRGGMAVVQAAVARGMGGFAKLVVLKKPRADLADQPEACRAFLNEARISARMNHPNVVQVYEVYEDDGLPVIVMEYLDGQSFATLLRSHLADAQSTPELPLSILCRALEGLQYAHTLLDFDGRPLNLIHRDVTPHNILVTYGGQVKLLDFGIARIDHAEGETKTGVIKGKVGYMPPEQVEGHALDSRTDLFPIGVMIWEVIAKQRMWGERGEAAVIKRLVMEEIPSLAQVMPGADPQLLQLCDKATAANPDRRYASARDLLEDLRSYLQRRGGVASDAAIAKWMASASAHINDDARQRIRRKLAHYSQASFTGPLDFDSVPARPELDRGGLSGSRPRARTDTGTSRAYGATLTRFKRARPGRWAALAAVGVPLGAALLWRLVSVTPDAATVPAAQGASAVPSTPDATPRPAAEATIRVQLHADPEEAVLSLDGQALPHNPVSVLRPRDGLAHQLSAAAPGFVTVERTLRFDEDVALQLSLQRLPGAPAGAPGQGKSATKSTTASRMAAALNGKRGRSAPAPAAPLAQPIAAPKPSPACDPPFSLDALGVKRYKPECFGK
jgi:eukaryotic-like serine/threonine-protein kinase